MFVSCQVIVSRRGGRDRAEQHRPYNLPSGTAAGGSRKSTRSPNLQHVEILAVLKLAVLFTEQPGQHLSGLHAGAYHAPRLVPVAAALTRTVSSSVLRVARLLQPNLIENADQQVVHVVVDPDRDLDELHPIGARHALAICGAARAGLEKKGKALYYI